MLGFLCGRCVSVKGDVRYDASDEWSDTHLPPTSRGIVPSVVVRRVLPLVAECARDELVRTLMVPRKPARIRLIQLVNTIQVAGRRYTRAPTTLPFYGLARVLFPASASMLLFPTLSLAPLRPLSRFRGRGRSWARRGRSGTGQRWRRWRWYTQLWSRMVVDGLARASRPRRHAGACTRNRHRSLSRRPRTRQTVGRGPRRGSNTNWGRRDRNNHLGCSGQRGNGRGGVLC